MAKPCALIGTNLFLVASIAATTKYDNAVDVPPEFTGTQLSVPHPVNGMLYLKLRDDPATVQTLTLPVLPMIYSAAQSAVPAAVPSSPMPRLLPRSPQPTPARCRNSWRGCNSC